MVSGLLLDYSLRILPGLFIAILFLALLPRRQTKLRIVTYILMFILIRDAMTPLRLWEIGSCGLFWIRFIDNGFLLVLLGFFSAVIVFLLLYFDRGLNCLLVWFKGDILDSFIAGILGSVIIVFPLYVIYQWVPIEVRGGMVPIKLILPILIIALLANLYEEFLFRGCFQGYMEKQVGEMRAVLLSGVIFTLGHVFLASTVTDIGSPILLFILYEGLIAAFIRMKVGVVGAALAHGLAIFILASGLI
jgi:membrane protease YdiL (CAAX protease family)